MTTRPCRFSIHGLWLFVGLLVAAGCSQKLGDSCRSNIDCVGQTPGGFCDLASPQGYCTVEGCDGKSCPENGACVRFFSLQRSGAPCTPARKPRADCRGGSDCCVPGTAGCCLVDEACLCDNADCSVAYCASETTERRWCMLPCDSDEDCREGYACLETGQRGAVAASRVDDTGQMSIPALRFCASK